MRIHVCMCTHTDSAKSSEENVPGPQFSIFVNPSNGFRLPEDPGRPIIMVCVCASTRARLHEYVRFCCSVLQQDEFIEKIASLCDVLHRFYIVTYLCCTTNVLQCMEHGHSLFVYIYMYIYNTYIYMHNYIHIYVHVHIYNIMYSYVWRDTNVYIVGCTRGHACVGYFFWYAWNPYICAYMHSSNINWLTHAFVCIFVHACIHACTCVHTHACHMYAFQHNMYTHINAYTHAFSYTNKHAPTHIHANMLPHTYTQTHAHTQYSIKIRLDRGREWLRLLASSR